MINVSLYLEGKCPQSTLVLRAFSSTIFKTVEKTLGTRLLSVETYREEGACLSLMLKIPEISVGIQMERSVSGFLLEYLESSLEMVRLFPSEYSDRTITSPFHF